MSATVHWQLLTTLSDVPSALVLAHALETDRVGVRVVSDATVLGQATPCRIYIDAAHIHRARWSLAQRDFSEEELTGLSTGEIALEGTL
jgi:hypothetical protein